MKKLIILAIIICFSLAGCSNPKQTYDDAVEAMKEEKWEEAITLFDSITKYEDSKELGKKCREEKNKHEKADYQFLEDMSKAILKRNEMANDDEPLEKCIDYDLTALSKYKEAEFYDPELQKLALQYIEGVEIQKSSLLEEPGYRQIKQYEGNVKRFSALKNLTDKYGMLKDNIDYQVNYYNVADKKINEYEAFKEVDATLVNLFDNVIPVDYYTGRVPYTNTTNHNFHLYLYITFKNEAGEIIENTEEYYEIKAQSTNQLNFYVPDGAYSWDYYTEEYIFD